MEGRVAPSAVSVEQAAARLGVTPRRVRAMIQGRQLDARKAGAVWLVDARSLDRRAAARPGSGRPFDPQNAWALLWLATDDPELRRRATALVSPWMRWYLVNRARQGGWLDLAPRLRGRAVAQRYRAHPGDLPRLAAEPGVVRTGVSAAEEHRLDVAEPGVLEAYVAARRLPRLRERYRLEPSGAPNVVLRVVDDPWPFPPGQRVAPALVAALDLLDAGDRRSQRAARALLQGHRP